MDRAESIVISILRPLEAGVYTIDYTIDVRDRRGRQAGNGEWPEDNIAIASNANVRLYSRSSDERSRDGSMSGDSTGARAQSSRARAVAAHAANDKEASEADDVGVLYRTFLEHHVLLYIGTRSNRSICWSFCSNVAIQSTRYRQ